MSEGLGKDTPPPKKGITPVAIIAIVVLGVMAAILVGLYLLPDRVLARMRDVSIAFVSVGISLSLLLMILILAVLVWGLDRLSRRMDMLLQQGSAILEQVKGTATTVKGTADFVGERLASPFIRVSARLAGIGQGIAAFFQGEERTGGST